MERNRPTQAERILAYITEHGSITRKEAAYDLGIFELAARIRGLEKLGYMFEKKSESYTDKWGEKGRCVRYSFPS